MDTTPEASRQRQRFVSRTAAMMALIAVLVVILFVFVYGGAGTSWILVSNFLFCVGLVGVAVCSIYRILVRVRSTGREQVNHSLVSSAYGLKARCLR